MEAVAAVRFDGPRIAMLARLVLFPLGIVLAAAVEVVFLPLAALFDSGTREAGFALGHAAFFALIESANGGGGDVAAFGAALSAGFVAICLLPLLIVALMGETFGVASGLWYVLGTGGLAALMPFVLRASFHTGALAPTGMEQRFLLLFFLTGAVGGALFWLVAGRRGMRGRPNRPPATHALPNVSSKE